MANEHEDTAGAPGDELNETGDHTVPADLLDLYVALEAHQAGML